MPQVNILVVEDEEAIMRLISFTLEQAGFNTLQAYNIAEAQTLLAEQLPDAVLLDWMLPDVSGIDFTRRLRQNTRTRDLPIILLTARGEESDKELGLNEGADDYITKPFSPRELVARINALLRRRAPRRKPTHRFRRAAWYSTPPNSALPPTAKRFLSALPNSNFCTFS